MGNEFASASGLFLLRHGSVLLLFLLVALFARRRWAAGAEPRRLRGTILSALTTIFGFLLFFAGPLAILAPILLLYAGQIILLYLVVPAFVAAALADLVLRALGATRKRVWLIAGIVTAVAITATWVEWVFQGTLLLQAGPTLEYLVEYLVLLVIPVTTATLWWSYLPLAPDRYAGTFE